MHVYFASCSSSDIALHAFSACARPGSISSCFYHRLRNYFSKPLYTHKLHFGFIKYHNRSTVALSNIWSVLVWILQVLCISTNLFFFVNVMFCWKKSNQYSFGKKIRWKSVDLKKKKKILHRMKIILQIKPVMVSVALVTFFQGEKSGFKESCGF